jgi:O-antigen/teichoic acid export membrane protein
VHSYINWMSPFYNIFRLLLGDVPAKALNFLTFVYLARVLGVANYGVLEFALSILSYFLLLADGGLELWATREAARGYAVRHLAARVIPLRFLLATFSFGALLLLLPVLPDYPALTSILLTFGLTLFAQAVSLKWVFLGNETMGRVGGGLALAQILFAAAVFGLVDGPTDLLWIPALRLFADLAMAAYFLRLFVVTYGGFPWPVTLRGASTIGRPALVMGGSQGLGLLSYNFDSMFLGLLLGPTAVGLYNAAYKPVTAALAAPITYYVGLFPALSRTFATSKEDFRGAVFSSLQVTTIFALPFGIMTSVFSPQIIHLLFGPAYAGAAPALQVLSWSAVLVTLRGTFRHGLNAAGKAHLELRCSVAAVILNVTLNLLLIPRYGILGAAVATVVADVLCLITLAWYFNRHVIRVDLHSVLLRPLAASGLMVGCMALLQSSFWGLRAMIGAVAYVATMLLLNGTRVPGLETSWPAGVRGK